MRTLLAGLAVAVALTGPAAAEDILLPPGVTSQKQGHGWVFAGKDGMTLYTFDRDEGVPGKSACIDDCAVTWPPLLADADAKSIGGWGFVERPDGVRQWAYKRKPIYYFSQDAFPGATFGDGVGTVWRVAFQQIATPSEVILAQTTLGFVLADARGHTLYAADDKTKPDVQWRPLTAPWLANPAGDWSVTVRADGAKQWAYQKKALFTYSGDVNPDRKSVV